jgi:5-methylcytosine-specific restriction endonuclease McrA
LDELEVQVTKTQFKLEQEVSRLSRNKHRLPALRELYWDPRARISVSMLSQLFRIPVKEVSSQAGRHLLETSCLLCSIRFSRTVPTRAARAELERERGVNPKWRICVDCRAFRALDLELLRKKPGERLTVAHRAAYLKYLRTAQWEERRQRALKRAGQKCSLCSRKTRLEVHHRTYERIGEERPTDLIVLCSGCHSAHHGH